MTCASISSTSGPSGTCSTPRLYSDGGVAERNPSPIAGVWAWCQSDQRGWRIVEQGGFVLAEQQPISNNQMEWLAALLALEAQPDGWSGGLATDSNNVLTRLVYLKRNLGMPARDVLVPRNLPWQWYRRMVTALLRLGEIDFRYVKGHPTVDDLRRGYTLDEAGERKHEASVHQVWCDQECQRQAVRARLSNGGMARLARLRELARA